MIKIINIWFTWLRACCRNTNHFVFFFSNQFLFSFETERARNQINKNNNQEITYEVIKINKQCHYLLTNRFSSINNDNRISLHQKFSKKNYTHFFIFMTVDVSISKHITWESSKNPAPEKAKTQKQKTKLLGNKNSNKKKLCTVKRSVLLPARARKKNAICQNIFLYMCISLLLYRICICLYQSLQTLCIYIKLIPIKLKAKAVC